MIGNSTQQQAYSNNLGIVNHSQHGNVKKSQNNKKKNKNKRKHKKKPLAIKAYLVQLDQSSGNQHNFSQQLIKSNFKNTSTIPIQTGYNLNTTRKWRIGTRSVQQQLGPNAEEKDQNFSLYDHHRDNLNHIKQDKHKSNTTKIDYDSQIKLNGKNISKQKQKQSPKYAQKNHTNTNDITTSPVVNGNTPQHNKPTKRKAKSNRHQHKRTESPLFWGNNYDINGDLIIGAITSKSIQTTTPSNSIQSPSKQKQHFYNLSISQSHTPIDTVYSFLSDYNELFNTDNLLNKAYITAEQDIECDPDGSDEYDEFDLSVNTDNTNNTPSIPTTTANSPYLTNQSQSTTNHRKATSSLKSFHQIYSLHQVRRTRSQFALLLSDTDDIGIHETDEEEGSVVSSLSIIDISKPIPLATRFDAYEGVKGNVLDMNMNMNSKLEFTRSDTADTDTTVDMEDTEEMEETREGELAASSPSASQSRSTSQSQSHHSHSSSNIHGFCHEFLVIIKNRSPSNFAHAPKPPEISPINEPLSIPNLDSDSENITDDEYPELFGMDEDGNRLFGAIRTPVFQRCESAPIQLIQSHSTDAMNMDDHGTHVPIYMTDEEEEDEYVHIENDSHVFDISNLNLPPTLKETQSDQIPILKTNSILKTKSKHSNVLSMDIFDDVHEFIKEYEDHEKELRKERKRWRKREREKRKRSKSKRVHRDSLRINTNLTISTKGNGTANDAASGYVDMYQGQMPVMEFSPKSAELPPKRKSPKIQSSKSERKQKVNKKKKVKRKRKSKAKAKTPKPPKHPSKMRKAKTNQFIPKRKSANITKNKDKHKDRESIKDNNKRKRKHKQMNKMKKSKSSQNTSTKKRKSTAVIQHAISTTKTIKKRRSAAVIDDRKKKVNLNKSKSKKGRSRKSKSEKKRKVSNPKRPVLNSPIHKAKTDKDVPMAPKPTKREKSNSKPKPKKRRQRQRQRKTRRRVSNVSNVSIMEPTPRMSKLEHKLEKRYFQETRQNYISTMIHEMFGIEEGCECEYECKCDEYHDTDKSAKSSNSSHHRTGPIYNGDDYLGEVFELDIETILTHINMKSSLFSCTSPSQLCSQSSL